MRANLIINESNQIAAKYVRNLNFHDMEDNFTISKKQKTKQSKKQKHFMPQEKEILTYFNRISTLYKIPK